MEIVLRFSPDQAQSLAGLALAASKDKTRPILGAFQFILGGDQITVTATDSYRLAQHHLLVSEHTDEEGVQLPEVEVLFEGHAIANALKKVKAKGTSALLTFDTEGEEPAVVRVFGPSGNFTVEAQRLDARYPQTSIILREIPWDEDWSEVEGSGSTAFNAGYLSEMGLALGLSKDSGVPVRILVTSPLKPAGFKRVENNRIVARGLLMPVRI